MHFISKRKLEKLAGLSLENSILLHFDSIVLFREKRYSSAYYLSVIAMEEMAKAKKLEHYYFYYSERPDYKFEQEFLLRMYDHSAKQKAFIGQDIELYSPKYYTFVESKNLDQRKLKALYVGLERIKDRINTKSRITRPTSVKLIETKQQVSIFNDELKYLVKSAHNDECYFSIGEMYHVLLDQQTNEIVNSWRYRSVLRSEKRWFKYWNEKFAAARKQNTSK